jgi:hypothetical protein
MRAFAIAAVLLIAAVVALSRFRDGAPQAGVAFRRS